MRRFLLTSLTALALIISAAGAAPAAHAEPNFVTPEAGQQPNFVTPDATGNTGASSLFLSSDNPLNTTDVAGTAGGGSAGAANSGGDTGSKGLTDPNFSGDTSEQFGTIMTWIMSLFAWLVGVAALTLDYVVYYTVVSMGSYVNKLTAIGVTWRILRDVANIMMIFGFLAIGVTTILGVDWYGGAKKLLPKLVFAAVAINFSLFVCEAMIDGTNLIATQFYQQINAGKPITQETLSNTTVMSFGTSGYSGNEPISNAIMGQLGLQTLYNGGKVNPDVYKGGNTWLIGFLGIILFMVTAFVLFSLALILVARFVALVFFILLSPVGFMGLALPLMEYRASQWRENFLAQIITAPVLLLLLYVALAIITDAQFLTGICGAGTCTKDWLGFVHGNDYVGFAGMLLSFMVAIGFLMIVVIKARSMAAFGAGWATRTAGSVAFGAPAWAARFGVGTGIGRGVLGNRFVKKGAVSENKAVRYGARTLAATGNILQNRTYDIRNAPVVGGALASRGGVGPASKITARQAQEAQYGVKSVETMLRGTSKEYEEEAAAVKRKETLATGDLKALQAELKKMSDDEIAQLKGIKQGQDRFVQALSPTAYGNLVKNKKLLTDEKEAISSSWNRQFDTHATSAAALGRMSDDERATLGAGTLAKAEVLENLSADDFDNVRGKLPPGTDRNTIISYVKGIVAGTIPVPPTAPPTLRADLTAFAAGPKFKSFYNIP